MKQAFTIITLLVIFSGTGLNLSAQKEAALIPKILKPVYFDVSPPLRDMASFPHKTDMTWKDGVVKNYFNVKKAPSGEFFDARTMDPGFQVQAGIVPTNTPVQNFEGTGNLTGVIPPDTYGDVGFDCYFQVVNCKYTIFSKTGSIILGPFDNSAIWNGLPYNSNDGDAVVLFDEQANRWFFSQFSLPYYPYGPFYQMIAVSQTSDPTGSWYRWEYQFTDMPDYPKFGVWPDGYYMSCNRFASGTGNYAGTGAAAFDRTAMLAGNSSPQGILFTLSSSNEAWSFLPSDCDGTFPSVGTPNYFTYLVDGSPDHLGIYEFHVDWITPSNSTFSNYLGLNVNSFSSGFTTDIPQPGTSIKLDPISDRLMYRLQYRKFTDRQSMVVCHTVNVGSNVAGVRWYELQKTTGAWSIYQQGTYSPDGTCRWMGSVSQDATGNIALGYSVSSSSVNPSIWYTGRLYGDALGTMTITESTIINGTGSQTFSGTNPSRWGDYSGMVTDPSVPNTFWYTQEYYTTTSNASWRTRIAEFQLGTPVLTGDFTADNTTPPLNTTVNFTDLSVGYPTSWSWSFSPSTVTYVGGTNSSSQNPKVWFTAGGAYTVTLIATNAGGSNTKVKTDYIHAGTPGIWTGITSTDWFTGSNWQNYLVPGYTANVSIPTSAPNWPVYPSDLTLGNQIKNLTLTGNAQLNVNGSMTVDGGYSLTMTGAGYLGVGGNWNNYGTFSSGTGTVEFTGATTSKIPNIFSTSSIISYLRTTFTKSMTPLVGGTAGPSGDDSEMIVSIGFPFNYMGVDYTQAEISTNGWVALNMGTTGVTWDNSYLFNANTPNATLAPWWDDLSTVGSGNIYYKTEGSAPNRVFTAEWNAVESYVSANATLNFQVKLYETTNNIEFCYGSVGNGSHNSNESASIGIEDATGGSGHFIEGTTGSTTTGITTLKSNSNWPTVNYRFSPPLLPTETFYNLYFNKPNTIFSIERNLLINGEFHVKP